MTFTQLKKYYGTYINAANAIGVCQPTISNWIARGLIPLLQQYRYQVVTNGALKVDDSHLQKAMKRKKNVNPENK